MNEHRVLNPANIKDIANSIADHRKVFLTIFEIATGDTAQFAQAAATAIGDISYSEAIEGVIDFSKDEMRKVKL